MDSIAGLECVLHTLSSHITYMSLINFDVFFYVSIYLFSPLGTREQGELLGTKWFSILNYYIINNNCF